MVDIKEYNIELEMFDWLKSKVGSYEVLFFKCVMKFCGWGLNNMQLIEDDYCKYMLEEYIFFKCFFVIYDDYVFIGNVKKDVEVVEQFFGGL